MERGICGACWLPIGPSSTFGFAKSDMIQPAPAFQFYARDWLASQRVQLLTLEEEGAYIRLLCHCWLAGSIPADEQLAIRLLGKGGINVDITTVLSMFQTGPKTGTLVHERLEAERRKQADWRDKSAEGGRNSAKKRVVKALDNQREDQGSLQNGTNQKATLQSAVCSLQSANNTPLPPKGDAFVKSEKLLRAEKIFNRRPGTPLGVHEQRAWRNAKSIVEQTTEPEWLALENFHRLSEPPILYRRQNLSTLLNNWTEEIGRALRHFEAGPTVGGNKIYDATLRKWVTA